MSNTILIVLTLAVFQGSTGHKLGDTIHADGLFVIVLLIAFISDVVRATAWLEQYFSKDK